MKTEFPLLCQIVQDVGIGDVPQRQTKRQRGGGASLRLDFARLSGQHLHRFGEGLAVKFHHKIYRKAALALAVPEPFVSADGQAVVGFPAVFFSAAHQRFALCSEKLFQIHRIGFVDLGLGVGHVAPSLKLLCVIFRFRFLCGLRRLGFFQLFQHRFLLRGLAARCGKLLLIQHHIDILADIFQCGDVRL